MMKPDQERVKALLLDTVSLLCKNSLLYQAELRVEGVIGITVDKSDVFIVHINENYRGVTPLMDNDSEIPIIDRENDQIRSHQSSASSQSPIRNDDLAAALVLKQDPHSTHKRIGQRSKRKSRDSPLLHVKTVKTERADVVEARERLGQSRVLPSPHGTDERELMRQGYPAATYESIGLENIQAAINQYEHLSSLPVTSDGEPAMKHRRVQAEGGPFITGIARNLPEHALPPGWNNVAVTTNSETSPGCSTWPGGVQANVDTMLSLPEQKYSGVKMRTLPIKLPNTTSRVPAHVKRDALNQLLVLPLMDKKCKVYAWRMLWHTCSTDEDQWRNVLIHRTQCEDVIKLLDGVGMFVSAIMATTSNFKMGKTRMYKMHPALAFWVVTNDEDFDPKDIPDKLANRCDTARVEQIGRLPIEGEEDLLNTLFQVLRHDNNAEIKQKIITELPDIVDLSNIERGLASRLIITDVKEFDDIGNSVVDEVDKFDLNLIVEK